MLRNMTVFSLQSEHAKFTWSFSQTESRKVDLKLEGDPAGIDVLDYASILGIVDSMVQPTARCFGVLSYATKKRIAVARTSSRVTSERGISNSLGLLTCAESQKAPFPRHFSRLRS
jgi:hypothetical protein